MAAATLAGGIPPAARCPAHKVPKAPWVPRAGLEKPGLPVPRAPRAVSYTHLDVYKRQVLVCLVLFTPVGIAFGMVALPAWLYLCGLGLILVPLVVMELAKAVGLVKKRHGKKQ